MICYKIKTFKHKSHENFENLYLSKKNSSELNDEFYHQHIVERA